MKRQPTNTKVTLTKEQTPNLKCVAGTAGMGRGVAWMEHCCQLEGAYVSESSCLDNVWPPWEDPTMPAEDLGRSILAFSPICARVTCCHGSGPPPVQPATRQQRRVAQKEASVGPTGLECGIILGLSICYPRQHATSCQALCHRVLRR